MKKTLLNLTSIFTLILCTNITIAQTPYLPPDKDGESSSNAMVFITNSGQLLDNTLAVRNDVKYYMPNSTPAIYAMEDRVSLVQIEMDSLPTDTITNDSATSYRIDMQFLEEGSPQTITPVPVEQVSQYYNYYLSYITGGPLTNVAAYDRIVYEEVWPGIDVHLTTNLIAPKLYFVIDPNADPDDISLGFTGQDDIDILSSGELDFDLNNQHIQLPELEAYEVDASTDQVNSLSWHPTWNNPNSGSTVTVSTGSYDTDNYLVLIASKKVGALAAGILPGNTLNWSTYAGTQGSDRFYDMDHDASGNNDIVTVGSIGAKNFATQQGVGMNYNAGEDGVITKFKKNGKLEWVTYYGSTRSDFIENVSIRSNGDIYFNAAIEHPTTPLFKTSTSGNFNVSTQYTNNDFQNVLGAISSDGLNLLWATYFGNDVTVGSRTYIHDMVFDNNDVLYVVGETNNKSNNLSFPITSRTGTNVYNQTNHGGAPGRDGFIAMFDANLDLDWLTYFGGDYHDAIFDITINPQNDIFFVGLTGSSQPTYPTHCAAPTTVGQFPVCNSANGGTVLRSFLYQGGDYDGFVAQILANGQLNWSRYMGGTASDAIKNIACSNTSDNTKPYYISVGGNTLSLDIELDCDLTLSNGKFCKDKIGIQPLHQPSGYHIDLFITKFDASFNINYATYLGGEDHEYLFKLEADENNNLVGYAGTYSIANSASLTQCYGSIKTQTPNIGTAYLLPTCPSMSMDPINGTWHNPTLKYYYGVNGNGLYNMYVEFANNDHQGYLFRIDDDERMVWATMFGASYGNWGRPVTGGMTLTSDGDLFVAQREESKYFPIYKPNGTAYIGFNQGHEDAFVSKFANVMGQNLNISMKDIEPTTGELKLFPNPSANQSILRSTGENIERYSIYDVSGKLIEKRESNAKEVQIDVSDKSQGIYIIEAETENKKETKKLIVK